MASIEQIEKIYESVKDKPFLWTPKLNALALKVLKETVKVVQAAQGTLPESLVDLMQQFGTYFQKSQEPLYLHRILIVGKVSAGIMPLFASLKGIVQPYLTPSNPVLSGLFDKVQEASDKDVQIFSVQSPDSIVEIVLGKKETSDMLHFKLGTVLTERIREIIMQTAKPVAENEVHLFSFMDMKFIGAGGAAEVFKANFFGQDVAVKLLKTEELAPERVAIAVEDPEGGNVEASSSSSSPAPAPIPTPPRPLRISLAQKEFAEELEQMERLKSPYLVRLYGGFATARVQLYVLELMGPTLDHVLREKKGGPQNENEGPFVHDLPWARRYQMALEIAEGVKFLHANRVVHCDLKPTNILMSKDGHCKISDFGIAMKQQTCGPLPLYQLKAKGRASVPFLAPELLIDEHDLRNEVPMLFSWRTDVYALGMIWWQMASRERPYSTTEPSALWERLLPDVKRGGQRQDIPENTPREFAELITKCWAQSPTDRPSIGQVVDHIKALPPPPPQ